MTKIKNKCTICMGHGWWPIGMMSPLGEMDSKEWPFEHITQCPECGVGGDNKSERYKALKAQYDKYKQDKGKSVHKN